MQGNKIGIEGPGHWSQLEELDREVPRPEKGYILKAGILKWMEASMKKKKSREGRSFVKVISFEVLMTKK